jgi:phage I-like protein
VGEYTHEVYGKIKMTVERAQNMARNIISKVRGIDLAIDYGHDSGGEAAGWVTSAEARHDGLWLFVEWTEAAASAIREGKYRYFSPEYVDEWIHPQSLEKFKDVMVGGGLTNRPFLKNILPVNLSEIEEETKRTGGGMEELLKKLREALKLGEDVEEEAILEALSEAIQPKKEEKEPDPVETLSEEAVAKILEEHPALAGVLDQAKVSEANAKLLASRVVNLELEARRTNVTAKLTEWHAGGEEAKHGLPVALDEKISTFMLTADVETQSSFAAILDEIIKTGLVPFKETKVRRKGGQATDTSVLEEVEAGIKKLMDDTEGLSYGDAAAEYMRENEEIYDKYLTSLEESTVDEENQGVES